MRIASWNVNSAKARQDHILNYLRAGSCDVLLIQETKTQDVNFPVEAYQELGWHVAFHGQKSYNGVAIAARMPMEDVTSGLPGDEEDEQARYMEATVGGVRVATIYLPNGNPAPGPKFDYKLSWMKRLHARAGEMLASEMPVVLGGDFNVIPQDIDCYDPPGWEGDALTRPESRAAFYSLCHDGYTDALRAYQFARWWPTTRLLANSRILGFLETQSGPGALFRVDSSNGGHPRVLVKRIPFHCRTSIASNKIFSGA